MDDQNEIDISTMDYDRWLLFAFDHPAPDSREPGEAWYWDYGFELFHPSQPSRLVEHVTRLCDQFVEVVNAYSLAEVDQGIWFLLGACDFGQYLRNPQISRDLRKSCVQSMYRVFADFVAVSDVEVMENCFEMWWDMLLGDFYPYGGDELDEDAKEIEDTILDTLTRILSLDDWRTQYYALHGLGHMRYPKAKDVVTQYIDAHGAEWTAEGQRWLQQCRDGTVM
jgi:hypothetical protein